MKGCGSSIGNYNVLQCITAIIPLNFSTKHHHHHVQTHHLHQWAPLQVADLIYWTGVPFLGVDCHCSRTMLISSKHLGPPWQVPSINLYITCRSDFINIMLDMVIPAKPSLKMRSSSLSSSFASSSLDPIFL